ncbi:MAG TPA: HAD hydrolase family protein [Planctomycetota bacterium]|nr:HAD hydrolase family protein [Planctomycetota bacterium]
MAAHGRPCADLGAIRMLITDVDGVLTDGRIHFDGEGRELKTFHVHDGAGLVYWHRCGGLSGFVSGRGSKIVEERARELGVHEVWLRCADKLAVVEDILRRRGLPAEAVAYVGDDLLDLPVMRRVGFAVSVPNGREEVRAAAHYVTSAPGGFGALREVVELLLRARRQWESLVQGGGRA